MFNEGSGSVTVIPNHNDPHKFKTVLNGEIVDSKVQLAHGDNLLFGNHNLYTMVFPHQSVNEEMKDYEGIMKSMMKDELGQFGNIGDDSGSAEKLAKMRKEMEEEKQQLEEKLKAEKLKMKQQKDRLAKQLEDQKKKIMEEAKGLDKNSDERKRLKEELEKQKQEAEKLRKDQKKKQEEFEIERKKQLQAIEDRKKEEHKKEVELMEKKDLEMRLTKLLPQLNEVNEICQNLGRFTYDYKPDIVTVVEKDGRKVSKLVIKAYPDRDNEFYNQLSYEEFEDKVFRIREKWENMQYDLENGDVNAELELEPDENEAEIFGLEVRNDYKLLGSVYIFCDSLASLLITNDDTAPILNSKGDTKGYMTYSLVPHAFDETNQKLNLNHYENVRSLLNQTLRVDFKIDGVKGLPEKYSKETYCSYQWVDETSNNEFMTEKIFNNKDPQFNYKERHDLFVSGHIADNLQYSILMVNVYGKITDERMEGIIQDLQARPHTSALLKDQFNENTNEPFFADKGDTQNVMKIGEDDEMSDGETSIKKKGSQKDMEKKMKELEKKLKKIQKENDKLKKTTGENRNNSSCCVIF